MTSTINQLVPISDDQLSRLDALIERLLELRDILDGDIDLEDGDEDRCQARDDAPVGGPSIGCGCIACEYPGSEDDAEDNADAEDERASWRNPLVV